MYEARAHHNLFPLRRDLPRYLSCRVCARKLWSLHGLMANCLVSIVYVHGLDSNPQTTTESRSSEKVSWVRDLLPKDDLNCRIMAFNHDTRWKSNALSKSLKDLGDDLIHALASKRETLEVRDWT